jgi:hypothetical protein
MPEIKLAFQMAAVVAGTLGGSLLGVAGGKGGDLARRGESRWWIDTLFGIVMAIGGISVVLGLIAGRLSQPPAVWLGLVGVGAVLIGLAWRIKRHLGVLRAAAVLHPE